MSYGWRPPYARDFQLARGGGSGGGTQQSYNVTQLPPWLDTAAQSVVGQATAASQRPYQANPYATVAPQTADQTQAYQEIQNLQGSTAPAFGAAEGVTQGLLGQATPITADQVNANTQALMNPYTTAVVAPAVTQMRQGLAATEAANNATAVGQGAFGGSRLGIQQGTAQAQEALGEGQLTGGLLSSGYNTAASEAMNMAGTNLGLGQWATTTLPQLAAAGAGQTASQAGLLQAAGQAQQGQTQAEADQAAQNWQTQWDYPYQALDVLEQGISGIPYGTTTFGTGTGSGAPSNTAGTVIGAAGAIGSLAAAGVAI
jgi:hypothetical protein